METKVQEWSVTAIARDVNAGTRTAAAVVSESLARARAYDSVQPQVWISRAADSELLAQAKVVDERIAAGEWLALGGVPVAIKDNIDVAGFATTAACPQFAYRPARSATR